MAENLKVNVLGTEYEIILNGKVEEYPNLERGDGYIDHSTKKIVIGYFEPSDYDMEDMTYYEDKVLRHEIVHAFMYESGLDVCSEWGRDETLVDWIALQFQKMAKTFDELEVMK